jgi:hypothetical protein
MGVDDEVTFVAEDDHLQNVFPEMNAGWKTYLSNIGHLIFRVRGCGNRAQWRATRTALETPAARTERPPCYPCSWSAVLPMLLVCTRCVPTARARRDAGEDVEDLDGHPRRRRA